MIEQITTEEILGFLTTEQKVAAKLLKNACVSAGAGSGKTRVLATRYVYLVAKYGFMPSEILTLTFTNKAAAEMYKRIFESLKEFEPKMSEPKARKNIQEAIKNFSEAKIQTLDSYCSSVIRSSVHHYGIPPNYSTDGNLIAQAIEKKSLEFLLSNRENEYLQKFLGTSKTTEFANSFFAKPILEHSTLANPIDFKKNVQAQIAENNKILLNCISSVNEIQNSVQNLYDEGVKLSDKQKPVVQQFLKEKIESPNQIESFVINEQFWSWFYSFYNFIFARKISGAFGELMESGRMLYKTFASSLNFLLMQDQLLGIIPLYEQFQDLVQNTKRTLGLLTFADTADLAIKTLLDYPEIRQIEKKAYKAIMIDEFQDDNILQKNLLFLISEKLELCSDSIPKAEDLQTEKLFFVGDEKQSIYRFRGADVEVFRHLSKELPGSATLSTNFRSNPGLIASFNSIFGGEDYIANEENNRNLNFVVQAGDSDEDLCVMEKPIKDVNPTHSKVFEQESDELFEATYETVMPDPKKLPTAEYFPQKVHVALCPKFEEEIDAFNATEMQAIYVAKTIKSLIEDENVAPSDIALLFRASSNQSVYERFLRQFSIPYTSDVPKSFFYDAPVNDIIALLKLVVYQNDYLSFLKVLKSPFIRLSENSAIEVLAHCRNVDETEDEKITSLIDAEFFMSLSEDEQQRFKRFVINFEELTKFAENHSIASCISKIWYDFGYVYETLWNESVEAYNDFFDYLFALATNADSQNKTISDFLDDLEVAKADMKKFKDLKIPLERKSAVQIMSIHASKGLEFKYVFVCELANSGVGETNTEETYYDEKFGVIVNVSISKKVPNYKNESIVNLFFIKAKEQKAKRSKAEIKRLLYVAITRAEEKVYLVGKIPTKGETSDKLSFYSILEPHFNEYTIKNEEEAEKSDAKLAKKTLADYFGNVTKNSPFSEELIIPLKKADLKLNFSGRKNTAIVRESISKELKETFAEISVIETPKLESNYRKPSKIHLQPSGNDEHSQNQVVTYAVDSLFKKKAENQDDLTEDDNFTDDEVSSNTQGFTKADFGIMAHACVEALYLKAEPEIPSKVLSKLTEKQFEIALNDAKKVAKMFYDSELGKLAQKADYLKTEYDFKMAVKKPDSVIIVDGQIDLLFFDKASKTLFIVDFKTDENENPQKHYLQLATYTKAAASFERSLEFEKTKTFLFYLRTAHAVDISDEIANIEVADYL